MQLTEVEYPIVSVSSYGAYVTLYVIIGLLSTSVYYYRILLDQVLLDVNTTLQFEDKAGLVNGTCSCQLLISKKMFQCLNES